MLVDITLKAEEPFQVTRHPNGKITLAIPLDVLIRSHNSYQQNKSHFDETARAREQGLAQH